MSLYPIISQVGYPGAGDVDECAIISLYRAIRQAGYRGPLPTIATFRAAAGVPDRPGKPDGLEPPQVMAALRKLLPDVKAELFSGTFEAFVARLADGTSASVAVWSAYLPSSVRYGFAEGHSIGIDARGAVFTIANPLGPDGSAPVAINARALRAAAGGYAGSGRAVAILIPPVEDTMSVATVTILVKPAAPRRFAVAAGVTLRGYDPARPGVTVKSYAFTTASGASFDAVCQIDQAPDPTAIPHGGPFLRVVDGTFRGLYIVARFVTADIGPDPAPPPVKRNLVVTVDGEVWKAGSF